MGFLPIRSSAPLFPHKSPQYSRGIAQVTGRDVQAHPEGDKQCESGTRIPTFAMSFGGESPAPD